LALYSNFNTKIAKKASKKDQKFVWTENCQQELDQLKKFLLEAPILQPIKNDRPIYLYIDASTIEVGGAVLQFGDDAKSVHVCAYMSIATTDTQRTGIRISWNFGFGTMSYAI